MIPVDQRAPFIQQRWVELYNAGAYDIPGFGVCEITGASRPENINNAQAGGRTVLSVTRPTEDSPAAVCINGPMPIAAGAYGFGTLDYPAYALYDDANAPAAGDTWGAASGTFELTKDKAGFVVLGDAANGIVRIDRAADAATLDIVRVYHSGSTVGEDVAANASGVHPGTVKRVVAGVMTEIEECWILFVDEYDAEAGTIKAVNGDYYGPARRSGQFTHSAITKPLYVLRRNFERIVHFELAGTLALSGNAQAIILSDDDADWADTALQIQVYDWFAPEGMWAGIAGYRGYAIRREGVHASGRQKYDILWMEQLAQTIQFTSTEYMGATTANRMAVTVNWYDHQGKQPVGSVIVRDPQGQFPDVHSGAKGTAVYDYQNGYYRVVSCQRVALFASALLTADSCGSSMSIDTFAVKPTGDYVGAPPTTPTAPANSCGHAGVDNDVVLLRRTSNAMPSPSWEVVDVSKHSTTIMTDVQVSGLTLQKKSRTVYVEWCDGTAPSWATWHTGGECP